MGYTTEFQGQFECRRVESPEIEAFLKAIREGDRKAIPPLADWLQDHGDPRGQVLADLVRTPLDSLERFWPLFGLKPAHAAYLLKFSETRRMARDPDRAAKMPDPLREAVGLPLGPQGAYFVGGLGFAGQDEDDSILDGNEPPEGQPGLWCQWVPSEEGTAILWNGMEKFYYYIEWLEYLIEHFLKPWGYRLNGVVTWQGEEEEDRGRIIVVDNVMTVEQ
jgi:hypothetical protein